MQQSVARQTTARLIRDSSGPPSTLLKRPPRLPFLDRSLHDRSLQTKHSKVRTQKTCEIAGITTSTSQLSVLSSHFTVFDSSGARFSAPARPSTSACAARRVSRRLEMSVLSAEF